MTGFWQARETDLTLTERSGRAPGCGWPESQKRHIHAASEALVGVSYLNRVFNTVENDIELIEKLAD